MRIKRFHAYDTRTAGGLLDGFEVALHRRPDEDTAMAPICILGPNGSGKSQFLQLVAEIFQAAWHLYDPGEERKSANTVALFELEYDVTDEGKGEVVDVRLSRRSKGRRVGPLTMEVRIDGRWAPVAPSDERFGRLLPSLVVGYTSGDNETLSYPFLYSRAGYAADVARAALEDCAAPRDNRMLLIDYGANLEVLFANLMLAAPDARRAILEHAKLLDIASCRCVIRLAHPAAPKAPARAVRRSGRKGIQLTSELERILEQLKRSATCWSEDRQTETYVFDFFVSSATREAFGHFFETALDLYRSLHKFSLLNDLAIPRSARQRLETAVRERRFASRLPEPQQEDLVFGFEQVRFRSEESERPDVVDYVSLSDGEHQQALILGLFSMIRGERALFILDEPESHFNPQWRIKFAQRLLTIPGDRGRQEVVITSHAPFVPADLPREQVLIFARDGRKLHAESPAMETFGANFDRILEHCFRVQPPISQMARDQIETLMASDDVAEVEEALPKLGASVEKSFVADHLRQMKKRIG